MTYDLDLSEDGKIVGNPEFHAAVDFDPIQARVTRERLLAQAARDRTLLMASHTPFPGLGYVEQEGSGWRWLPLAVVVSKVGRRYQYLESDTFV